VTWKVVACIWAAIDDNQTSAKYVESAVIPTMDGGSTPPISTKLDTID